MEKKLVALDAGHNCFTAGKQSPDGSYREYEFNADVRDRLARHLLRCGVNVVFVDSDKSEVGAELAALTAQANKSKADIYVSLHSNASGRTWSDANGWEAYCFSLAPASEGCKLAQAVRRESIPFLGIRDRGVKDGSAFYVIRRTNMPAVLIEHGFHTNKKELVLLKSDAFREKCAMAGARGILRYFGIPWIEPPSPNLESEMPSRGLYRVQTGAFAVRENADRLAAELKSLGYDCFVTEGT